MEVSAIRKWEAGLITKNEARSDMGHTEVEDGDEFRETGGSADTGLGLGGGFPSLDKSANEQFSEPRQSQKKTEKQSKPLPVKPTHIIDLETRLTSQLGTKVSIETRKSGQRGKIIIDFYSLDEFDRITENLGITATEEVYK